MNLKKYIKVRKHPGGEEVEEEYNSGETQVSGFKVYQYSFAHDTPDLDLGVDFYTPTINDLLLDFWFETTTAWNGTTPSGDIGSAEMFSNEGIGLVRYISGSVPVDLTDEDDSATFGNLLRGLGRAQGGINSMLYVAGDGTRPRRAIPAKFVTEDPLQIVVSQDGSKDSSPSGSTIGESTVCLLIATPVELS